jgi:hypothetical protein
VGCVATDRGGMRRDLRSSPRTGGRSSGSKTSITDAAIEQARKTLEVRRYRKRGMRAKVGWVWELPGWGKPDSGAVDASI